MLRAAGRLTTRLGVVSALAVALAVGALLSGCGETDPESDLSVEEGQHVKLGDLLYNVQISRFLNPSDPEDRAYLAGQPPPPNDKLYLGVFMLIENESDAAQEVPADFTVIDTAGTEYDPIASESLFALDLGGTVPPNEQLPGLETTAANGPIQGAMVLFLIDEAATEDRPLVLDIPSLDGEAGEVELDI
jgi:hypothetical protein